MLTVAIPRPSEDGFLDHLRAALTAPVEVRTGADADGRVLVDGTPEAGDLDRRAELALVVVPYAGVPARTRALVAARPRLALHNLHHNAAPTAEHALALLLAAAKRIVPADRALRDGDWTPRFGADSALLDGSTLLVLGAGAIGARVADAGRALGMDVAAVRRRARDGAHGIDELDTLLPRARFVVVALPLTDATRGLLDAARLARIPDGGVLVNVGRGPIVDEAALYAELARGRIAAGLDVWYRYPRGDDERAATAPADHAFGALDNVVLSPHRAGHCDGIEELRARHLAALLDAAARGEPVPNRVDPEAGY